MRKFLFILIGLIFLIIFIFIQSANQNGSEKAFNKIVGKTNRQLAKKYNMSTVGIGGRETKEGISNVSVSFSRYQGSVTTEQARNMIIDCVETYIRNINNSDLIKPFLIKHPFTFENFEITIINYQNDGSTLKDPDIKVVKSLIGKIFYCTENSDNHRSETSESYLEALKIVKNAQSI